MNTTPHTLDEDLDDFDEEDYAEVRPITIDEFYRMTDEELEKTIDPCWRPAFHGKDHCTPDCKFYLHDGAYYSFLTGLAEGWRD